MLLPAFSSSKGSHPKDSALTAEEFGSTAWNTLYQHLGDPIFDHLLKRCSMFRFVSGFNFLQLSGPVVATARLRIHSIPFPSPSSSVAEKLADAHGKASNRLEDHKLRLYEWKKRKREVGIDEIGSQIETHRFDLPPPKKRPCPHPFNFLHIERSSMYYKHPKKIHFGLPRGWKGLHMPADETGAQALASWIYGTTISNLPKRVLNSLYLFKSILKRLKKIYYKPILDSTCPLHLPSNNPASEDLSHPQGISFAHPTPNTSLTTQSPAKPSTSMSISSSFNPTRSQILPDFPLMTSSGMNKDYIASSAPQTTSKRLDDTSDLPFTQEDLSKPSGFSHANEVVGKEFFDYNNEDDYLLHLLIEPVANPVSHLTLSQLLPLFSRHHQVSQFVQRTLRGILPHFALGSDDNWKLLDAKISDFVALNRFDIISSELLLEGFKVTQIPWLAKSSENKGPYSAEELCLRTKLLHSFIVWIFEELIIPLLGTTFYITETMMHRNQMFYFRREVWSRINELGFETLISRGILRAVSPEEAKEALKRRELGACHIRFLPKRNGVRPIVNMKKTNSNPERPELRSINSYLKPIHSILTHEAYSSSKDLLASSLMTNDEVHRKLLSFKRRLLQLPVGADLPSHPLPKLPKLYFVKVDVVSAFDEVNQQLLMKILEEDVVNTERYLAILVSKTRIERERLKSSTLCSITSSNAQITKSLPEILEEQSRKQTNSILSKTTRMGFMDRPALLALLREHIMRHLIRFNGQYYVQRCGIPQGSTLSSLLCSLYFAHLEKTKLSSLLDDSAPGVDGNPKVSVLLRWIDDFLFISTDHNAATAFFEAMHAGFPEYGTRCNPEKSQVNFDLRFGEADISNVSTQPYTQYNVKDSEGPSTSGIGEMIWCGWLINTTTLEFRRAVPDGTIASQLVNNNMSNHPGLSIANKLHAAIRNATYPLLFDCRFSPRSVLLENVYDIAAWSAVRLVALERGSQFTNTLAPSSKRKLANPKFFVDLILSLIQHFSSTLSKKANSEKRNDLRYRPSLTLNDITIMFLHAFRFTLKGHLPLYQHVLEILTYIITEKSSHIPREPLQEYRIAASNRFPKFAKTIF